MPDPVFPEALKPVISQGYSFDMPDNIIEQPLTGGSPLLIRDTKYGYVDFQIVIIVTPWRMQVWNDFYYVKINSGASKFLMNLDSGNGIEEHTCQIVPSSVQQNFNNDPTRFISYTVRAEKTPFQNDPYGGLLVDLFDEFGDDFPALLDRLAIYVNEDMPEWIPA